MKILYLCFNSETWSDFLFKVIFYKLQRTFRMLLPRSITDLMDKKMTQINATLVWSLTRHKIILCLISMLRSGPP